MFELWAGFLLGLLGSFHCLGMCGPIAIAVPHRSDSSLMTAVDSLLYNGGRIVTYTILGALAGAIGASFRLAGLQEAVSIVLGVTLLLIVIFPRSVGRKLLHLNFIAPFVQKFKVRFRTLLNPKSPGALVTLGLLNGLLPCGLVYVALTASLASGSILSGAMYMGAFGLGTLPMMGTVFYIKKFITVNIRQKVNKLVPYGIAVVALILILRGLALGIPYISPPKKALQTKTQTEKTIEAGESDCCH